MTFAASLSAFETSVENFVAETEADVQAVIANIGKGVALAESTLASALSWVASEVPTIVPYLEEAISFATAVGAASNPEAATVIAAAQTAVAALNAVATAQGSGASSAATLLAGYTAIKTTQAAGAQVTVAATQSVVTATTPAAAT